MKPKPNNTLSSGKASIETLEMRGIVKRFPGVLANDHVNFDVCAGDVHALLGENGAGKSTLMKILYGLYHQDEGNIVLNGDVVTVHSPSDAIGLGIGMIHQHFMLVESLTVAENVALGLPSSRGPLTDLERVAARISELASIYGLQIDPATYVWQLSVGQQQRVEIMKALYRGAELLILDEPTAVLTPQEVDDLFVTLRQMSRDGHALIFISHKLHEVLDITDRITVMRDGRVVGAMPTTQATKQGLARMMVGREVHLGKQRKPCALGAACLTVRGLYATSERGTSALKGVDLEVRVGEILGVAGVSGNGQRELAEVITGLRSATGGYVLLDGQDVTESSPAALMEQGMSYIPEERMRDGMIKEFTVSDNLILREHHLSPYSRNGFMDFPKITTIATDCVRDFDVRTPSTETPARNLSGGNMQKLILARELSRNPSVLVAAQPTRGVDIGASEYIHERLLDQRVSGTATLLISEDLDEILALSDRIAVMYEGQIMSIVPRQEATPEKLGLLMAGVVEEPS
ncbi:MAG: ABC transporter ATP-binding protein [Anaerolineales bacterium]|nr:ABC transporter ATP-binding protein [Anaerolineales bacterium]